MAQQKLFFFILREEIAKSRGEVIVRENETESFERERARNPIRTIIDFVQDRDIKEK